MTRRHAKRSAIMIGVLLTMACTDVGVLNLAGIPEQNVNGVTYMDRANDWFSFEGDVVNECTGEMIYMTGEVHILDGEVQTQFGKDEDNYVANIQRNVNWRNLRGVGQDSGIEYRSGDRQGYSIILVAKNTTSPDDVTVGGGLSLRFRAVFNALGNHEDSFFLFSQVVMSRNAKGELVVEHVDLLHAECPHP